MAWTKNSPPIETALGYPDEHRAGRSSRHQDQANPAVEVDLSSEPSTQHAATEDEKESKGHTITVLEINRTFEI
jgi:hypothetical protein